MGVEIDDFIIYNGIAFIRTTSNKTKKKYSSYLRLNGFSTFNLRLKKPYLVKEPIVITTPEGAKSILYDYLTDGDLNTIREFERYYFLSQREFEEYLSALMKARGIILTMANRPATIYLLTVAEKYGIRIPVNVQEHKPILNLSSITARTVSDNMVEKANRDYKAMFSREDTNSPLTEFYFPKGGKRILSRRLKQFKSENVIFDDGSDEVKEKIREKFNDDLTIGILKWTSMR